MHAPRAAQLFERLSRSLASLNELARQTREATVFEARQSAMKATLAQLQEADALLVETHFFYRTDVGLSDDEADRRSPRPAG